MKQKVDIGEGYSMNYLIHAFFIIITGIVLFLVHHIIAIVVIILGAILLLAKTGVELDIDKKTALPYRSILTFKFGKTIDLATFSHVLLKYKDETTHMQSRGAANVIRTKTYSILLSSEDSRKVLLHEFIDYRLARELIWVLMDELKFNCYDEVEALRNR